MLALTHAFHILAAFDSRIPKLGSTVERYCEFAAVTDERPWVVKPYVDDRLDGMKAAYNSLPEVNDRVNFWFLTFVTA
jgi:hypothetical protein